MAPAVEQVEQVHHAKGAAHPDVTVEVGRALQEVGAGWLEDPIHHQNYIGIGKLRDMPVTGGEYYYTLTQVRECLGA